jgi:Fe-S-cluster containining protein
MKVTKPFFADGLRFDCTRCQRCCRIEPGFVFLSARDIDSLATFLSITAAEVQERYCRPVDAGGVERLSLQEQANYDCVFWRDGGCSVYEARPTQCQSFPFWSANVEDTTGWEEAAKSCPGVDRGPSHSAQEIGYWLQRREEEPLLGQAPG